MQLQSCKTSHPLENQRHAQSVVLGWVKVGLNGVAEGSVGKQRVELVLDVFPHISADGYYFIHHCRTPVQEIHNVLDVVMHVVTIATTTESAELRR